jgi:UDP-3-O-[3-hydroxymyristoyl] N-acetylglucosamine deacetylase
VRPARRLHLAVTIAWNHPAIGWQTGAFTVTPEAFRRELAGARTFGFLAERAALAEVGLGLGASPENCVVLTEGPVPPGVLRWPDEFLRHKTLDLLGDVALLGSRFHANVRAVRPNHAGNVALGRAIRANLAPLDHIHRLRGKREVARS